MNARPERKLRLLAVIAVASAIGGIAYVFAQGFGSPSAIGSGIAYGLILGIAIASVSLFVLQGPMRGWLGSLSFTADLMVRSAIYAAIIVPIRFFSWATSLPALLSIRLIRISGSPSSILWHSWF